MEELRIENFAHAKMNVQATPMKPSNLEMRMTQVNNINDELLNMASLLTS